MVSKCPTNKTEWDQAASRKKCSHITDMSAKCGNKSPIYHCLLNQWRNETVEVCASTWYISGNEVERSLMFMTSLSCSQSSFFCKHNISLTAARNSRDFVGICDGHITRVSGFLYFSRNFGPFDLRNSAVY